MARQRHTIARRGWCCSGHFNPYAATQALAKRVRVKLRKRHHNPCGASTCLWTYGAEKLRALALKFPPERADA